MTSRVVEYQQRAGHASCVLHPWVAPAAFGGGGSPPLLPSPLYHGIFCLLFGPSSIDGLAGALYSLFWRHVSSPLSSAYLSTLATDFG